MDVSTTEETLTPNIPEPRADNVLEALRALKEIAEVREGCRGDPLDQNLTYRDLFTAGLMKGSALTGDVMVRFPDGNLAFLPVPGEETQIEFTRPPAPANLTATAALASVILEFDDPGYHNHAHTEIWRAGADDLGAAVKIGTTLGPATLYADMVGITATARYYWARHVSQAGVPGPFNATAGTSATTNQAGTSDLVDLAVTTAKIADLAVVEAKIGNLAVTTAKIDNVSITTAKIALLAVTTATIDDLAVTTLKVANLAITEAKIDNLAVTTAKIDNLAVTTAKIANLAVTNAQIANATIALAKIDTASITNLSALSADMGTITAGTITLNSAGHIKSGSTDYDTGDGWWLGLHSGAPKLSLRLGSDYLRLTASGVEASGFLEDKRPYAAGSLVLAKAASIRNSASTSYVLIKQIHVARAGTITTGFFMYALSGLGGHTVFARIYVNDVAVGTERSLLGNVSTPTEFTENISVSANDRVQLYIKTNNAGTPCFVKDFYVSNSFAVAEGVDLD